MIFIQSKIDTDYFDCVKKQKFIINIINVLANKRYNFAHEGITKLKNGFRMKKNT